MHQSHPKWEILLSIRCTSLHLSPTCRPLASPPARDLETGTSAAAAEPPSQAPPCQLWTQWGGCEVKWQRKTRYRSPPTLSLFYQLIARFRRASPWSAEGLPATRLRSRIRAPLRSQAFQAQLVAFQAPPDCQKSSACAISTMHCLHRVVESKNRHLQHHHLNARVARIFPTDSSNTFIYFMLHGARFMYDT